MYELIVAQSDTDSSGSGAVVIVATFMGLFLYFVPTVIAALRRVRNLGSVIAINVFLGWSCIGWVVALAMALRTVDKTPPAYYYPPPPQGYYPPPTPPSY